MSYTSFCPGWNVTRLLRIGSTNLFWFSTLAVIDSDPLAALCKLFSALHDLVYKAVFVYQRRGWCRKRLLSFFLFLQASVFVSVVGEYKTLFRMIDNYTSVTEWSRLYAAQCDDSIIITWQSDYGALHLCAGKFVGKLLGLLDAHLWNFTEIRHA